MDAQFRHMERTSESLCDVAEDVVRLLKQANETIGVAESLTGGGLMAAFASIGGVSSVFRGGVVSYATPLKQRLLAVDGTLISQDGVINAPVAEQMAAGARNVTETDTPTTWGLSTTGVAGPDRQDGKPVGTVFIGVASPDQTKAWGPFQFAGDRNRIREATVLEALVRLREMLIAKAPHNID